ncbi:RPM1 interacting protein 13-like isoform X1 [Magnolia sinica]|uniref:RPM1 interacting protein 13-like isoform X1 n=1 Tax=Magnolia sinica TaxID=86752 RepID=UPI002657B132|nr:RPM1 interacting protein 13-like isoform X1 [Magnolia sinica]
MAGDAVTVIEISSSDDDDYEYTRLIPALRPPAKKITPVKTEKKENKVGDLDCFILDFDPFEAINLSKKLVLEDSDDADEADEVSVVSERGPVACRDYPHSRHLCANFPFNKTPHKSYCKQCYCYVCDEIAPCKDWEGVEQEHCQASDRDPKWKLLRVTQRMNLTGQTETHYYSD